MTVRVKLHPHTVYKRVDNLEVDVTWQDWVAVDTGSGFKSWGFCDRVGGVFVPLSGFPRELVPEVQRQVNELRGCAPGTGPAPLAIEDSGPTNQDQEIVEDDEEEYEDEQDDDA